MGTYSGESINVLVQVALANGSRYNFAYNSAGQVTFVQRYTNVDNVYRSHIAFDYGTDTGDVPRLAQSREWAENWAGANGVPNEVTTTYSVDGSTGTLTTPDGTQYKEFYGTGWQKGLVTQSEVWAGGVRQKWTTTSWTQAHCLTEKLTDFHLS